MGTEVKMRELPPCDFAAEHGPAAVDGRTRRGPWAYMCAACWAAEGVGRLGTGFGQRLVLDVPEGPSAPAEHPEAPPGPVVPAEAPASASAAQGPESEYVREGWWHPNVKAGQVHDHPADPGRSWSAASHRMCEGVYTRRSGQLRRCAGCGWETIADRCPHCGADVEGLGR